MKKLVLPVLIGAVLSFVGCSEGSTDDNEIPAETTKTNFTVTIENVASEKAFVVAALRAGGAVAHGTHLMDK